jgi:signal transduction histidine kinase/HAMP domain-containing protein
MSAAWHRFLRNLSIKRKLTLIIMATSMVALLIISAAFLAYEVIVFRQSMVRDIQTTAEIIAYESPAALIYEDNKAAGEILSALRAKQRIVAAGIYKDGRLFAQYPTNAPNGSLPGKPQIDEPRFQDDGLVFVRQVILNGEPIGLIYLKSDLLEVHQLVGRHIAIILLFILASGVVSYLLSSRLQKIISRPISHLAETAHAVSTGKNYSVRAVKQSNDEVGQFIDGFNEMLTQIQERDAALQQAHDKLEKRVAERTRDLQSEIVERGKTQEALRQQLTRMGLLNQITQIISERQDLPGILQVVLRQLEDNLPVDMGSVHMQSARDGVLAVAALQEKTPRLAAKADADTRWEIALAENGLDDCQSGKTVYLRDTWYLQTVLARQLADAGMRSAVAAPLMVAGRLFGILLVARAGGNGFSSGEREFLRTLSEHVALAAHQARLHTELETAYDDLRQTQQAVMQQDRLRALGQMASGIAHDVNNALSPVVGFAGLLLSYEPNLSPSARKHLNYIKTAGEDVAHIVARLREFYRQRDGREPLFPIKLNQLVEQVIDLTRPRWRDIPQSKGNVVDMHSNLAAHLPEVNGIEGEVRDALTNLILNAVDAMPQGGKCIIRTRAGCVGVGQSHPTHALIEVTDTGMGMSAETRQRCLEPFFSTKGKRGTGMGLPMVFGVMERHEGKLEIESEPGRGTTVRLIFPLRAKPAAHKGQVSTPAGPLRPLRILCIDDEPLLRELVKEILERDGHTVQAADGGQTGLDAFRQAAGRGRPFDVVITDLGMPHLDGREVAKTLKKESPLTPVILLTGWGAFMKSDGDVPAEVAGVLCKPPQARELRELLVQLVV